MLASLACIPCLLRQTLLNARLASKDEAEQRHIMGEVLRLMAELDYQQTPPEISIQIQTRIRDITGVYDPYQRSKSCLNKAALALYPRLKAIIQESSDPLWMAVRLAISGNAMDMGANGNIGLEDIYQALDKVLQDPFDGDFEAFSQSLSAANSILYLADNSGEIVFDRVLIEEILPKKLTVVVRGGPALNDATLADAQEVGLDKIVEVIDNGYDAPGTVLNKCSPQFQKRFSQADMIIAKGQGNFETLDSSSANVFFLFKAKCEVITNLVNKPLGTQVLLQSRHHIEAEKAEKNLAWAQASHSGTLGIN